MSEQIRVQELSHWIGRKLQPSEWITIEQSRIDMFADCTEDHQFIHVDPERARREAPFGTTIAHGFLSLSLMGGKYGPADFPTFTNLQFALNYGMNRMRFITPVRCGARVRIHTEIAAVAERDPGRYLVTQLKTMEIAGEEKPAWSAEHLAMLIVKP